MAKKQRMGGGFDPFSKKVEVFQRDYGQFSIAKIHSVHEDLGVVVGLLDEHTTGAIPIEWFIQRDEVWRPNGLACPYVYDSVRRREAIDKYNEIKDEIEKRENERTAENAESGD